MTETSLFAKENANTKKSLVLSGGGMRLSYQAGALLALQERKLNFQHVDATSGGSLNLSMLLSGLSPKEVCEQWRTLDIKDSISLLPLNRYIELNSIESLGDADGMRENVFPHLKINCEKIRNNREVIGTYNVLDYGNKKVKVIPHEEIDEDMMVAGISLPGVFPPVRKNGSVFLDTAFIQDANLMEAVKQGAEEIWLIWGLGNTAEYKGGPLNIYVQMLETSANGALNNEIKQIQSINELIKKGESPYGQQSEIRLHVISPKLPLPLDPDLYLGKINNQTLIEMGYADAILYLENMSEQGVALGENITAMQTPEPGIRFKEELCGGVALETPAQFSNALENELEVTLSLTHHIHDLNKFINEESQGRLTGSIKFSNAESVSLLSNGIFRFFEEIDADTLRLTYQAEFTHEGEKYRFVGEKHLHDDFGFDMWKDLSVMHFKLYYLVSGEWHLTSGGQLKLNLINMAQLIAGIQATGVDELADSASTLAQFSKFYLREAGEVYF